MARHPLTELSERERACLRLVCAHHQSKEIARILNLSKRTVDGYLDSARAKLGASTRVEAARLFASQESGDIPDRITGDPITVPFPSGSCVDERAVTAAIGDVGTEQRQQVNEARAIFTHEPAAPDPLLALPISSTGRPTNDLTALERLAAVGRIAGGMVFYLALLLAAAEALTKLALSVAG